MTETKVETDLLEQKDKPPAGVPEGDGAGEAKAEGKDAAGSAPEAEAEPKEDARQASEQAATKAAEAKPQVAAEPVMKVNWARGGIPLAIGVLVEFCLCAADMQFRWGVPAGIL